MMEAKTDLDISRKPARMPSQFSNTDGFSIDFGTFDKHGFIYVPSCTGEQCQSAPGTGDCAAATQASSLQDSDSSDDTAPPGESKVQKTPITKDPGESFGDVVVESESKVQKTPITKDPGESVGDVVVESESKVQKTAITKDPGESVGDVIVDRLTKRKKLDVDSPDINTGSFHRAKLMDNLKCLAEINKMSNRMRRKERKTSGEQAI